MAENSDEIQDSSVAPFTGRWIHGGEVMNPIEISYLPKGDIPMKEIRLLGGPSAGMVIQMEHPRQMFEVLRKDEGVTDIYRMDHKDDVVALHVPKLKSLDYSDDAKEVQEILEWARASGVRGGAADALAALARLEKDAALIREIRELVNKKDDGQDIGNPVFGL